jgi:hypothetical protein
MPISSTIKRFDGNIYINADGIRTDVHGVPLSAGAIELAPGANPNGILSSTVGAFAYDATNKVLWACDGGSVWTQLI